LSQEWKQRVRGDLLELRGPRAAWSYRRNGAPGVEPTALACLGLLASGDEHSFAGDHAACRAGAAWLAAIQRAEGALPVSESLGLPGWATPYAILLWSEVPGYEAARRRARSWLLALAGKTIPRAKGSDELTGDNLLAVGWPWVDGTHSWLEPTALAILALCREGLAGHPRVDAGIKLILDRSLSKGGWNYGNKSVFGQELRPLPGPTGLALLALAARGDRSTVVTRALEYLRLTLPNLRSAVSLGWGVLGLRAHGACPLEADAWLAASVGRCAGRVDAAMSLAMLLLAAGDRAIRLIVKPGTNEVTAQMRCEPPTPLTSRIT